MQQKFAEATEAYGNAARVCTRQKQFDRALELQQKRVGMCSLACNASSSGGGGQSIEPLVRTAIGGVVVALACKEDARAAQHILDVACNAHGAFHASQEAGVLQMLVNAYTEADEEALSSVLKHHLFKYCENEVRSFTKLLYLIYLLFTLHYSVHCTPYRSAVDYMGPGAKLANGPLEDRFCNGL